jgi:hypothetical protein
MATRRKEILEGEIQKESYSTAHIFETVNTVCVHADSLG